jgi:hypothetical protein
MTQHAIFPAATFGPAPLDLPLDGVGVEIVHCAEDGTPCRRERRALSRYLDPLLHVALAVSRP